MQILRALTMAAALGCSAIAAQAAVIFQTDFESGMPTEITGAGTIAGTGTWPAGNPFGRQHLRNGSADQWTVITLNGLVDGGSVGLQLDLLIWDSWDGATFDCCVPDYVEIEVDGVLMSLEPYRNVFISPNEGSGDILYSDELDHGFNGSWDDSAWRVIFGGLSYAGTDVQIRIRPTGAGFQGGDDESLGLDNIIVTGERQGGGGGGGEVSEPATLALLGAGLLGLAAVRRRRTR
jgi:hypothetical protein